MKQYLLRKPSVGKVAIFDSGFFVFFYSSPEFSGSFLFWLVLLTENLEAVPYLTVWFCTLLTGCSAVRTFASCTVVRDSTVCALNVSQDVMAAIGTHRFIYADPLSTARTVPKL